jgi:hypothetical protein
MMPLEPIRRPRKPRVEGWVRTVIDWICCHVFNLHDDLRVNEINRFFLKCTLCHRETPGIFVGEGKREPRTDTTSDLRSPRG